MIGVISMVSLAADPDRALIAVLLLEMKCLFLDFDSQCKLSPIYYTQLTP